MDLFWHKITYQPWADRNAPRKGRRRIAPLFLLLAPALLEGCAVGPRLAAPAIRAPVQYITGVARTPSRQSPFWTSSVAVQWWTLFHTPLLSHYIRAALQANPKLAAARATLAREDALMAASAAGFLPQAGASATAARARALRAGANGGSAYRIPGNLYNLLLGAVQVSYSPDVFGQASDQLHSAEAERRVAAAQLRMTEVFLEAAVARAVIQAAGAREQWKAARLIAADDQRLLDLLRLEYRLGASNLEEVRQQEALTASAKAAIPPLRAAIDASRYALADLLGRYPNQALRLPRLGAMKLPSRLPIAVPSALLEQRPDIDAARAETEAAKARANLAAANRFPRMQITAEFGKAAQSGAMFFNPLSTLWSLGAGIVAPIYEGGALAAKEKAAIAQYMAASNRYRATVFRAFEQVADALRALQSGAHTYEQSRIAAAAAAQALTLARGRYRDGEIAYSSVLEAEIAAQRDTQAAIEAQNKRYLNTVALFLALGEGWSGERVDPTAGTRS
jgi:NodT family efflux transporter outer membrane factor (OMF) lipoprotein